MDRQVDKKIEIKGVMLGVQEPGCGTRELVWELGFGILSQ